MARSKKLQYLVLAALLIIITLGLSLWQFSNTKSAAATAGDTFMQAIITKDTDSSYALLGSELKAQFAEAAAWEQWVTLTFNDNLESFKLANEEPLSEELRGNAYTNDDPVTRLLYEIGFDGKKYTLPLVLSPDNAGKWLVDDIGRFETL